MDKIMISEDRYGPNTNPFLDDDLIDRLNNKYTVMMLMMSIFIISSSIYVGKPINCWTPAEFKGQHDGYANSVCWLKGSYYLPTEEITIPDRSKPRTYFVAYYQWTPFILLGMALLFLVPKFIWHTVTRRGGLNIRRLVGTLNGKADADKGVDIVKKILKNYFDTQNNLHGSICCGCRCPNFYIGYTIMYFSTKILYVINTLTQFFLLNAFLSFNFSSYGAEGFNKLFTAGHWIESPRFPLVTMCDFMVRRLGSNQHWYAIQCTLPINLYNEKIFLAIWFWLIILTILNVLSIISWIAALTPRHRLAAIKKYLRVVRNIETKRKRRRSKSPSSLNTTHRSTDMSEDDFKDFANYLHMDGFLIFQIIASNTDEMTAGKIIEYIYGHYPSTAKKSSSDV